MLHPMPAHVRFRIESAVSLVSQRPSGWHRQIGCVLLLSSLFVSCNEKEEPSTPDAPSEIRRRTTHAPRPVKAPRMSPDVNGGDATESVADGPRKELLTSLDSAKTKAPSVERDQELANIAWQSMESAPDLVLLAIRELSSANQEKPALIGAYIQKLMGEGREEEASAWAASLENAGDIACAKEKIALILAAKNPEQAAALLPASSFTAETIDPSAVQTLQHWTAQNPAEAVAWAARLPLGTARDSGLKIVFSQWIQADTQSALEWVSSQHRTPARKETIRAMSEAFAEQPDPIRNALLEPANPTLRNEIEQNISEIIGQPEEPDPESQPEAPPEPSPDAPAGAY